MYNCDIILIVMPAGYKVEKDYDTENGRKLTILCIPCSVKRCPNVT